MHCTKLPHTKSAQGPEIYSAFGRTSCGIHNAVGPICHCKSFSHLALKILVYVTLIGGKDLRPVFLFFLCQPIIFEIQK